MNIKKTGTSLAIVFSMLAFNAAAQADCTEEIRSIKEAADNLRCTTAQSEDFGDAAGQWDYAPIWQKAAGKGKKKQDAVTDGCETHQSIAKKLYEERDFDGKPPPRNKNNTATGAAHQLAFGKFQDAIDSLTAVELTVDASVVNPDFGILEEDPENPTGEGTAEFWAAKVKAFATDMKTRIDPALGCQ